MKPQSFMIQDKPICESFYSKYLHCGERIYHSMLSHKQTHTNTLFEFDNCLKSHPHTSPYTGYFHWWCSAKLVLQASSALCVLWRFLPSVLSLASETLVHLDSGWVITRPVKNILVHGVWGHCPAVRWKVLSHFCGIWAHTMWLYSS